MGTVWEIYEVNLLLATKTDSPHPRVSCCDFSKEIDGVLIKTPHGHQVCMYICKRSHTKVAIIRYNVIYYA